MARLQWGLPGSKVFETGISHGVLYVEGLPGVPWDGLVSVNQNKNSGEFAEYYMEGVKYLRRLDPTDYKATLTAFTYPDEFERCDGSLELSPGFHASYQDHVPFGLTYRTLIGDDIQGTELGYRTHFVYNAMANPQDFTNATVAGDTTLTPMGWELNTIPLILPGLRPSAHFSIDSRRVPDSVNTRVEAMLFGTSTADPRLPLPTEIASLYSIGEGMQDFFTEYFEVDF